jgi:hypothetical protein
MFYLLATFHKSIDRLPRRTALVFGCSETPNQNEALNDGTRKLDSRVRVRSGMNSFWNKPSRTPTMSVHSQACFRLIHEQRHTPVSTVVTSTKLRIAYVRY